MPSISVPLTPIGALLIVNIGISVPRQAAMQKSGLQIPPPATGTFLLDTGASTTCVDPKLVRRLGIDPSGSIMMQTPSTNGTAVACNQYDVSLYVPPSVPGTLGLLIPAIPITETMLSTQGIDGLLGRDVIDSNVIIYNGSTRIMTLSF